MAVPCNLIPVGDVVNVIPFLTVAKPVIDVCGVNSTSEIMAISVPSLYHFVILRLVVVESTTASKTKPFSDPVEVGGPTSTL